MKSNPGKGIKKVNTASKNAVSWAMLFNSPEGHIFLAGSCIMIFIITWFLFGWSWSPENYQRINALVGTRLVMGRPGSIYFGNVIGVRPLDILWINMLFDTAAVLILYPLFVLTTRELLHIKFFKKPILRTFEASRKHHDAIQKYGAIGLFAFVLFPLWGTGPVVGSAIGILMGFSPWFIMGIVLTAAYLAVIIMAFFVTKLHIWLLSMSFYAPVTVIIIIVVVTICFHIKQWVDRKG